MFGYKPFLRKSENNNNWFWTPITKWLHHGGWFYLDVFHPLNTVKWWIRFTGNGWEK